MDLFLSDDVPTPIKKLVADRIREVEGALISVPTTNYGEQGNRQATGPVGIATQPTSQQSPSMQRIMAAHPDVQVVTAAPSTAAAAEALAKRAAIINHRGNEKPEPGRTSPRKF